MRKDLEIEDTSPPRREDETKTQVGKVKKKKKVKAEKRGVCHVSRVPPRMDHVKLRQVLSQFGEIQRIYLVPEGLLSSLFINTSPWLSLLICLAYSCCCSNESETGRWIPRTSIFRRVSLY